MLAQLATIVRNEASLLPVTLLSRIDGDAPRAKSYQRRSFWIVREQASFKHVKPLYESIRTRPFERQPFRRSQSDSQLL